MLKKFHLSSIAATFLTLSAGNVGAFSYEDDIHFNGFLTAGVGITNLDKNDSAGGSIKYRDVQNNGISDKANFNDLSLIGFQVTVDVFEGGSVVGQLVANGLNDFSPDLTWGYFKYDFNDNWSVIAGRFRTPLYFYSQTLDIGYSYPWLTLPEEIYVAQPAANNINGLQISNELEIGDEWNLRTSGFVGADNVDYYFNWRNTAFGNYGVQKAKMKIQDTLGINAELSNDIMKFYMGFNRARMKWSYDGTIVLQQTVPGLGVAGQALPLSAFNQKELLYNLIDFAYELHWDDALLIAEVTRGMAPGSAFGYTNAGYLTLGYQIGKFLPTITAAASRTSYVSSTTASYVKAGSNTYTAALRYDWNANVALKAQYQYIQTLYKQMGPFTNFTSLPGRGVSVFEAGINIIF